MTVNSDGTRHRSALQGEQGEETLRILREDDATPSLSSRNHHAARAGLVTEPMYLPTAQALDSAVRMSTATPCSMSPATGRSR